MVSCFPHLIYVQRMSDLPFDSRLVIQRVCAFTHLALFSIFYGIVSDTLSSSSMSAWMAEMADAVEAAEVAAPAPPLTKASPQQSIRTASIDETPTEPATSPRMMDNPVREWPVELQLPTGQIGP